MRLDGIGVARVAARTQPPVFVEAAKATPATLATLHAVVLQPAAVKPALTPRIQDIKTIEPAVALRIAAIPWIITTGLDRSQLTAPVAPAGDVADTTIFEDPKDASVKYFVMAYRLNEESTTRGRQFSVRMLPREQHWELAIALAKAAPDAILQANPGARELAHQISLLLRYKQRVNGQPSAVAEASFTQTVVEADVVRATLTIETLAKRDEIYRALTDPELGCMLIVRRMVRIAIPVPSTLTAPAPQTPMRVMVAGRRATPLVASPALAARLAMRDRLVVRDFHVATGTPPPAPLYRETDRVLDLSVPFTFDPNLHRDIFEGVGAVAPGASQGLVRRQITWNGQQHIYYQDDGARNLFYYLPDTFKIARRPAAPHEPLLSIRFDSEDGSKEKMQVTCTYCAVPVVNRDRLTSTLPALRALVPPEVLVAAGGVALEPLLPDPSKINLKLAYPGADTRGGPFAARPQATVDLRAGIVDALTMTLDQFRAFYDALFSTGQLLFTGGVRFDMGGTGEEVPFRLRLHDTAEPFADWSAAGEGGDAIVSVTNEVESALRLRHIDAIVEDGSNVSVKPLQVIEGGYPIDVAPAATTRFRVPGLAGGTVKDLDFSDVESVPDKDTLYDVVLDPSTAASYLRPIKVKTFKPTFDPSSSAPEKQVMSIVVDFEDGTTVELTTDQLEASVNVPVPLAGFVLGRQDNQTYRYKVTVVRLSGATPDPDWRTGESGILFPALA